MIENTKSKVFFVVMMSLSMIIISTILVINIVNYNQSNQESYTILDRASNMLRQINPAPNLPYKEFDDEENKQQFYWQSYNFYFVFVDDTNTVSQIINKNIDGYSDDEIREYTLKAIQSYKPKGRIGNLIYEIKNIRGNKIITFMDDSIAQKSIKFMILMSIIIAIIALIFAYLISRKISIWIVKPIEETLDKQKQFISDASHELKTPLAVICANADTLEGEIGYNKWLNYIQKEVISMDKLVNSLLSLARVEKEKDDIKMESFDLSKTILGGMMAFECLAFENEIELIDDIEKNLKLKGNKEEIKQLLSILLDNAIKHTKKGGKIIVSLNKNKNNIILKVKNMGEPILKEEENKIFERFYRSDSSRNRDSKRYGLGLAIAKSIVEKHNGKIKAHSQGGFTTFTVVF